MQSQRFSTTLPTMTSLSPELASFSCRAYPERISPGPGFPELAKRPARVGLESETTQSPWETHILRVPTRERMSRLRTCTGGTISFALACDPPRASIWHIPVPRTILYLSLEGSGCTFCPAC